MLRLSRDGMSAREIGRMIGVARTHGPRRIETCGGGRGSAWPLPPELTDEVLEETAVRAGWRERGFRRRPEPDWAALARELKRPASISDFCGRNTARSIQRDMAIRRFCDLFREFERRLSPTCGRRHEPGDKVFVDYSGKKIADRRSGHRRDPRGRDLRRRAWRLEPHLCRGELDATAAGLDRLACADVPLLRRRAEV